ncbi:hypothetical protein K239x_50710 [Planctomycetes bacterium K23_9]|uniref:Uncharacterized protein n=2 Tax=Stieleria marina TaxID=1930275 RepID=A0A517P0Z3_9BACT|nr:hypothetical protein K239x_50710 [Planctomycetes bacterium K23_9]
MSPSIPGDESWPGGGQMLDNTTARPVRYEFATHHRSAKEYRMSAGLEWIPMLLQSIVSLGGFLFLVGAIIYIAMKRQQYGRPASLLLWAFSLLLTSTVGNRILHFAVMRYFDNSQLLTVFSLTNAFSYALSITAYVLVIRAVFVDRQPSGPLSRNFDGRPLADQPSDNPYAAPHQ